MNSFIDLENKIMDTPDANIVVIIIIPTLINAISCACIAMAFTSNKTLKKLTEKHTFRFVL